jgi:hypothetical protein
MKSIAVSLWVLLVPLVTGCGKSDSEKFADAYCAEMAKCCGQAGLPTDGKICHQLVSMASGSYNSKAGDACLADMRTQVAAGTFCSGEASSAACDSVFGNGSSTGNKQLGEACEFDDDCARSSEGLVKCDLESNTCVARKDLGASCSFSSDCVPSTFCDFSKDVCTARVAAGNACTGTSSDECVDGYYCPSSSGKCTAQSANGASCTLSSECKSLYCSSGTCQDNGLGNFGLAMFCGSK